MAVCMALVSQYSVWLYRACSLFHSLLRRHVEGLWGIQKKEDTVHTITEIKSSCEKLMCTIGLDSPDYLVMW